MPVDIKILIQRIYLVEYESENDAACHDKDEACEERKEKVP